MIQVNTERPLVSVVIPCYNHEAYVQETIQSVVDQDYDNIELIIIDDGSKDSSVLKILEMVSLCEKRFVRFEFRHRENRGLTATLNEALDWCKGIYFSPIASDDVLLANKISFLVPFLEKDSSLAAVFGGVLYIDDAGNSLDVVKSINSTHVFDDLIMGINIPSAPASVIKRDCILEVGKYDQSIGVEDWFLWLKLTEKGWCLKSLNAPVVKYRRHLSNMTNNYKKMHENRMLIVRHFENHYVYSQARSNLYIQAARESATHEVVYPLRMIMKAQLAPLSLKMLVLVKVITPKWLIVLSRRFREIVV